MEVPREKAHGGKAPQVTKIEEFIAEVYGLLIFDRI
jgi:hypothetical protein